MYKKLTLRITLASLLIAAGLFCLPEVRSATDSHEEQQVDVIRCANLVYSHNKSSVCFSDEFLADVQARTYIKTNRRFIPVKSGSADLFNYPFAVMTGEGAFTLTQCSAKTCATI